ncbi:Dyp-type peroxidase [Ottowia sp.]|jgi:putative iron-dependent peroxidase|uniref:Dyp-type peroxidase n=1 Tax=Ottowia sp. TaxID=1898956 RepID=UPI0025EBFAE4|nr:Dyp-type peroxidase [Ottowia sp.]MBK6614992.1 Dyp-type peroxidase [Ottowia sp.]MBK6746073.1 Dyp-type peroxidase [Ottowia sp.]
MLAADHCQAAILQTTPPLACYLSFTLFDVTQAPAALRALAPLADGRALVLGVGQTLAVALGRPVAGLRDFPQIAAPGVDAPATPGALWCWLRGDDRGDLLLRAQQVAKVLAPAFALQACADGFRHGGAVNRDLSSYEDGTENPEGDKAVAAAIDARGASFVAVQQWRHDFARLAAQQAAGRMDDVIGRHHADNSEYKDAPASSHVKRTDQDSFKTDAHILRRNMAWGEGLRGGTMFVGFGHSLDAFEMQWRRMMGVEDGVTDGLFTFTRPVTGAYFWCPPVKDGRVDLGALGI